METMKAMICTKYGPPDVLQIRQCQKPIPKADEVLIKVYATSVTNSDLFIRGSNIPLRFMIPMRLMLGIRRPRKPIIGEVLAGVIEHVGSAIKRFHAGDHIYGLTGFSLGAYAEYACMKGSDSKQGCLAIKPSNISFEAATSAAYGGLLAFQCIEKATITRDQSVLIYGASSTSGTIAIQYLGACPGREGCAGVARNGGTAMSNATRATVATFGTIAALAGIEHRVGEIVRGNRTPAGIMIESWPDSALFAIVGGEPAMTIVPNLLLTGILAISVSLIVFVWTTRFVQRTHGGLILMLLSIILLLVGGGFGPPLLGIILGVAALGINARFPWWRAHLPHSAQHALSAACPWSFGAALIAWLLVMPGSKLLDIFFGIDERALYTFIIAACSLLLLTITTGFVRDMQPQSSVQLRSAMSG